MFIRPAATIAQIAANRANSVLSTGPRTPQGKAVSSKNATSHGLYAAIVVVHAWENQADFDLLRQQYIDRFRPQDRVESGVIDRMVDSEWRRNRVISIETTLFNLDIDEMKDEIADTYAEPEDGLLKVARAFRKNHGEGVWDAIQRHLAAIDRAFQRALRDLRLLQGDRFNLMPAAPKPIQEAVPEAAQNTNITERSQLDAKNSRQIGEMPPPRRETAKTRAGNKQKAAPHGPKTQSEIDLAA